MNDERTVRADGGGAQSEAAAAGGRRTDEVSFAVASQMKPSPSLAAPVFRPSSPRCSDDSKQVLWERTQPQTTPARLHVSSTNLLLLRRLRRRL